MKKRRWIIGTLLLVSLFISVNERPALFAQSDKASEVALKGEVVDLHCYMARGAKGAEHAACTDSCISRGVSAGFLAEDGKLYLLLESKPVSVKDRVANLGGRQVRLSGTMIERDGVKAIMLSSIEQATESQKR